MLREATVPGAAATHTGHDAGYERRAVILLSLGFGLVGFDRMMILPLFPTLARELSLTYTDIGIVTGALAISWAFCALFAGHLSDTFGFRRTLVTAMIAFSLLVGLTGLATGLILLVVMRVLMGAAEGAFVPPSIAATADAAMPSRRGLVLGVQQMASPLFGFALAPLLVTQLLTVVSWEWIFALLAIPGLLLAWLLHRTIRTVPSRSVTAEPPLAFRQAARQVIAEPNVKLLMLLMLCMLTVLIVLSALLPSYLSDTLRVPLAEGGIILSAIGFGAVCGALALPAVSDRIGRRATMIGGGIGLAAAIALVPALGANRPALFVALFAIAFFAFGMLTLVVAVIPGESVQPRLQAIATGAIIFVGEIFGGGVAPMIAGLLADRQGLEIIFPTTAAMAGLAILVSLALSETAPLRSKRPI